MPIWAKWAVKRVPKWALEAVLGKPVDMIFDFDAWMRACGDVTLLEGRLLPLRCCLSLSAADAPALEAERPSALV